MLWLCRCCSITACMMLVFDRRSTDGWLCIACHEYRIVSVPVHCSWCSGMHFGRCFCIGSWHDAQACPCMQVCCLSVLFCLPGSPTVLSCTVQLFAAESEFLSQLPTHLCELGQLTRTALCVIIGSMSCSSFVWYASQSACCMKLLMFWECSSQLALLNTPVVCDSLLLCADLSPSV